MFKSATDAAEGVLRAVEGREVDLPIEDEGDNKYRCTCLLSTE